MQTLPIKEIKRAQQDIEVLLETARDPFLVLDKNLRVVKGNQSFYRIFKITKKQTEKKLVYNLGTGQWGVTRLKKLLENILPNKKVFQDFEVEYNFPKIGKRTFLLNARQLDSVQLIILSFEDITQKRQAERAVKKYTQRLESEVAKRTKELSEKVKDLEELTQVMVGRELKMSELKKEIARIKKLKKLNGNGRNGNGL